MEGFEKHNLSMKKRLWESFELKPFVKVAIEGRKCPFHCNKRSQGGTNERNARTDSRREEQVVNLFVQSSASPQVVLCRQVPAQ